MTDDELQANLLRLLNTDRLAEAAEAWKDDPAALAALESIRQRVADGEDFSHGGGCDDCSGWDGVSRRCNCGNRRVCWHWDGQQWEPEAY